MSDTKERAEKIEDLLRQMGALALLGVPEKSGYIFYANAAREILREAYSAGLAFAAEREKRLEQKIHDIAIRLKMIANCAHPQGCGACVNAAKGALLSVAEAERVLEER